MTNICKEHHPTKNARRKIQQHQKMVGWLPS